MYAEIIIPAGADAPSAIRFPSKTFGMVGGLLADATGKKDMPSSRITRHNEVLKHVSLMLIITP
jgi:hypothetical protein